MVLGCLLLLAGHVSQERQRVPAAYRRLHPHQYSPQRCTNQSLAANMYLAGEELKLQHAGVPAGSPPGNQHCSLGARSKRASGGSAAPVFQEWQRPRYRSATSVLMQKLHVLSATAGTSVRCRLTQRQAAEIQGGKPLRATEAVLQHELTWKMGVAAAEAGAASSSPRSLVWWAISYASRNLR